MKTNYFYEKQMTKNCEDNQLMQKDNRYTRVTKTLVHKGN